MHRSMASKQVLVVSVVVTVAAILAATPAPALALDLLVGDSQGWRLGVDYDDWVDGHDFMVGDMLEFKYAKGRHTVVRATAASFEDCIQDNSLAVWTSGDDKVVLNKSGNWWFFCGMGNHCQNGMKFKVTVLPLVKLSSSSPPAQAQGRGVVAAGIIAGVAAVIALLL